MSSTSELPPCPQCHSEYTYTDRNLVVCSMCGFEWDPQSLADEDNITATDANGTVLQEGDKATVVKDLKIKGSSQVIKVGTKLVIRRIKDAKDHELDCRVDGVGEMMVTAKFVKKA
ncbi:MAG: alkylphosphonate utilization protein [Alteromonadaceae bacterium]|nr:alkylphosphonate utilization protein [Alteromonadaceae bacterium]